MAAGREREAWVSNKQTNKAAETGGRRSVRLQASVRAKEEQLLVLNQQVRPSRPSRLSNETAAVMLVSVRRIGDR